MAELNFPTKPNKLTMTPTQRLDALEETLAYQFELITALKETLVAIAEGFQKGTDDGQPTSE